MLELLVLMMLLFLAGESAAQMEIEAHTSTAEEELQALLGFRRSADRRELLSTWSGGFSPCNRGVEDNGSWVGVECYKGHVFKLVLEDFHLQGGIEQLLGLRSLRVLSLKNNALNGSLPRNLSNWRNLKFLYLGGNRLDGELPSSFALLTHLWRLDLSRNLFSGPIPDSMNALDGLLTLRLEDNGFSGSLPALQNLTMLVDFNVSDNRLQGVIPKTLQRRFNSSTFLGNVDLCGLPLSRRCNRSRDFHIPAPSPSSINEHQDTPAAASPISATSSGTHGAVSKSKANKLSTGAIIAIVVGDTVVLVVMTLLFLIYYWNKYYSRTGSSSSRTLIHLDSNPKNTATAPKVVEHDDHFYSRSSGASSISIVPASNKLVFVDHRFRSFDLEDLLRASAEMLGKGSLGSAYKAVLEDGFVVAVKRLKDVTSSSRKEFEQHMDLIARMKSPNLVHLRAFYYAKDEKLLVYDFMPNGSLHTLLHGNRGPGRVPVDWTTRLKIALGAAKGLAHIHQESGSHKIPHGNIKSSNVLLDKNGVACVGDFGLALLMNTVACSRLVGYRAPEHSETRRISQKGDVYSFGVLLLEILTGKSPVQSEGGGTTDLARWVQSVVREEWTAEVFDLELMRYKNIEEEMVTLLQIAMSCVAQSPDARPKMSQVVKLIEEIRGDISPGRDESFDSQSQSSYLSEDAPTSQ